MAYYIYRDTSNQWRWRLVAANRRIIANSGEGYWNKTDCIHAIDLVVHTSGTLEPHQQWPSPSSVTKE